eukprot:CAMPEP_0197179956 /NCGR_PEP_ID=MMETSP1423-20130617/4743_1 /TAXON_ID=476441 /ORGANISM="Pseudo-nitzschia heimii, Strain UNC1101" /LENGTH=543 /DNA_ID=CAMNT_0042629967 /DNA_START=64 /DNA_END=1695 /DNA_ORIENTATION=+
MGRFLAFLAGSSLRDGDGTKSLSKNLNLGSNTTANFDVPSAGTRRSDRKRNMKKSGSKNNVCARVKPMNGESFESRSQKLNGKARGNESNSKAKPFVEGVRRILGGKRISSKPNGRSGLFSSKIRIRKTRSAKAVDGNTSPTSGTTMTDESPSLCCRDKGDESPRSIMLLEQLSFRDTDRIEKFKHDPIDDVAIESRRYQLIDDIHNEAQYVEEKSCESTPFLSTQRSSEKAKEITVQDAVPKFSFSKAEVIENLFPMGYPKIKETVNVASQRRETIDVEKKKFLDSPLDSDCEDMPTSQFQRSEIIACLFPMGHPDDKNEEMNNFNSSELYESGSTELHKLSARDNDDDLREDTVSTINNCNTSDGFTELPTSMDQECDKLMGLVISFDPTWELLAPELTDSDTTNVKGRLKKFHEIENYQDSLLGKLCGEESSEESIELLADLNMSCDTEFFSFSPMPMLNESMTLEDSCVSFVLGYHFDCERFRLGNPLEDEICFCSDESSIESIDDSIGTKGCEILMYLSTSEESDGTLHFDNTDSIHS